MLIQLKKFGTTLISRPAGREAFSAIRPQLHDNDAVVQIDFSDVLAVTPSWVDEFLTLLLEEIGDRVELLPSDNLSVRAAMSILVESGQEPLAGVCKRFMGNVK